MDAVIRSKLLYGLDTAQLNEPELKRLDQVQLKAIRKILKLTTTCINRSNTDIQVIEKANDAIKAEQLV